MEGLDLAQGLAYFVVFLFSTTVHEAAHAWAALVGGDRTAYHGGQVTLDPRPHIRREPFGMVILPLLTSLTMGWPIGYASAPYDPNWAVRHPKRAALMALAGPAANIVLVLVAALLIRGGMLAGVLELPSVVRFGDMVLAAEGSGWDGAAQMIGIFFSVNLLLAVFNLLPFPPLDGSGAIPLVLSPGATARYQQFIWGNPMLSIVGMFIAWQLIGNLFRPIFFGAVRLLYL